MSAVPDPYERQYNFTDYQESNPTSPLPADEVDAEFNAVATAINDTQDRLAEIQNDDGTLKNASVGNEQLKSEVTIGLNAAAAWVTATGYVVNDTVYQSNNIYRCLVAHTAGTFATDLAAGKWTLVINMAQYVDAANASATAAAASEVAAELAETNAETAEANAEAALVSFQNNYLGSYSSAPSVTPSGAALAEGMLYWNSTDDKLYIRNNSSWVAVVAAINSTRSVTFANGDGVTTSFNVTYDVGLLDVYVDGVKQRINTASQTPGANYDVGASNGTAAVFAAAPASGTRNIQFVVLGAFSVASVAAGSIDTAQLADGAVTPAKSEPGAYAYATVDSAGVYNMTATFTPPVPSLTNGTVVRIRPRTDNWDGSQVSVTSITSSSTTATVSATAHGFLEGDTVSITGASPVEYNGFFKVASVPTANSFTYKFKGSSTTPATGTISAYSGLTGGAYAGELTFSPDGLTAKPIRRRDGTVLLAGDIKNNREITLIYNSSVSSGAWLMQNDQYPQFYSFIDDGLSSVNYTVTNADLQSGVTPLLCSIRMMLSNTTTTPTLAFTTAAVDIAYPITREGGGALRIGDIAGGGWALLQRNGEGWELLNPKSSVNPVATLQHQTSAGVSGGATTSGSWETAPYNTEVSDADGIVSLSSNDFTLAAGTYLIRWVRQFNYTAASNTRLYNVTDASVVAYGTKPYVAYGESSHGEAVTTITSSKAFRIQSRVAGSRADGFGAAVNWGTPEVFGSITIQKLA